MHKLRLFLAILAIMAVFPTIVYAHVPGDIIILMEWYSFFLLTAKIYLFVSRSPWQHKVLLSICVSVITLIAWLTAGRIHVPINTREHYVISLFLGLAPVLGWVLGLLLRRFIIERKHYDSKSRAKNLMTAAFVNLALNSIIVIYNIIPFFYPIVPIYLFIESVGLIVYAIHTKKKASQQVQSQYNSAL